MSLNEFSQCRQSQPVASRAAAAENAVGESDLSISKPLVHLCSSAVGVAASARTLAAYSNGTTSASTSSLKIPMDLSPDAELPGVCDREHSAADMDELLDASDSDVSETASEARALDSNWQRQFGRQSASINTSAASAMLGIEEGAGSVDQQRQLLSGLLSDESDSEFVDDAVDSSGREAQLTMSTSIRAVRQQSCVSAPSDAPDETGTAAGDRNRDGSRAGALERQQQQQPSHALDSTLSIRHSADSMRAASSASAASAPLPNQLQAPTQCDR